MNEQKFEELLSQELTHEEQAMFDTTINWPPDAEWPGPCPVCGKPCPTNRAGR